MSVCVFQWKQAVHIKMSLRHGQKLTWGQVSPLQKFMGRMMDAVLSKATLSESQVRDSLTKLQVADKAKGEGAHLGLVKH